VSLINVYKYRKGGIKKMKPASFQKFLVIRGNDLLIIAGILEYWRFCSNIRKHFFTVWVNGAQAGDLQKTPRCGPG